MKVVQGSRGKDQTMDTRQFDTITKRLARSLPRRQALSLLGAAAFSAALGQAPAADAAETCRGTGKKCTANGRCCSGRCSKKGRCRCSRMETRCRSNADCCQGDVKAYCDLRCLDPECKTCAPTDQPTGYCKDDSYCGGVRP